MDPFLNSGVSLAILHLSGKVDSFIDKLIISQIGFSNTSALSFKNLGDISSISGALETSKQHNNFLIVSPAIQRSSNFSNKYEEGLSGIRSEIITLNGGKELFY